MKAMKYILIVMTVVLLPLASANAQFSSQKYQTGFEPAQASSYEFRTTSSMASSGSSIQTAAQNGVVFSGSTPGESSSGGLHGGIRRIGGSGSGTGGNEAEENDDPQETPLGDGMWVLMLLAAGYGAWMMRRIRARRNSGEE